MRNVSSLTLCSVLTALAASAQAAPARPGAKSPSTRVVMMAPVSQGEASFRTLQAVRGQLSDVAATLTVHAVDKLHPSAPAQLRAARSVARRKKAAVVFWFDAPRSTVSIYLHDSTGGRLLQRPVKSAGPEGQYEALAVIVRFAVRGRRQGEKVGVRLPPPRPAPPTRRRTVKRAHRPPPAPRPYRLRLEAGYGFDLYSNQVTVAHGLRIAAVVRLKRRWSVFAGFRMEAPLDAESDAVALSLRRYPMDLGARFLWRQGRLSLGVQLALSLAVVTARTTPLDLEDGDQLETVPTRVSVAAHPALVVGVRIVSRLTLLLTLGARIPFDHVEYRDPEAPHPVLSPWRVHPTGALLLHVPLY